MLTDDGRWTWRELDAAADAAAGAATGLCRAEGIAAQSVGLVQQPPGFASIAAVFGLGRARLVAAPLHDRLAPGESDRALRVVRPALRLAGPASSFAWEPCGAGAPRAPRRLSGVDVLLLTSGTSGGPKAVGLRRRAFAASAVAAARRLSLSPGDRWGLCLSLGHVGGLALVLRAVALRCAVRCWPRFDADSVARAVLRGEVTHLSLVPAMLRRLLDRLNGEAAPPSLRCVLVGGAALSPKLLEQALAAGLPVAPTWGMTETASQVATAPPALARRKPGTVGPPLPGLEVEAGAGAAVGRREERPLGAKRSSTGVLSVRGPSLASVVIPGPDDEPVSLPVDSRGWFRTPDVGRVDADGHVWVTGRADDAIVTGGVNVAPGEVERVIEDLPGVSEAVVFGVPDEQWGRRVAAVVEASASVRPADVDRHCRARLSRPHCPSRIEVVASLPRMSTGKTDRAAAAAASPQAGSLASTP